MIGECSVAAGVSVVDVMSGAEGEPGGANVAVSGCGIAAVSRWASAGGVGRDGGANGWPSGLLVVRSLSLLSIDTWCPLFPLTCCDWWFGYLPKVPVRSADATETASMKSRRSVAGVPSASSTCWLSA